MDKVISHALVGICTLVLGVLSGLGISMALESTSRREVELEFQVKQLEKDLQQQRSDHLRELEGVREEAKRDAGALHDWRVSNATPPGLGCTREAVLKAIRNHNFKPIAVKDSPTQSSVSTDHCVITMDGPADQVRLLTISLRDRRDSAIAEFYVLVQVTGSVAASEFPLLGTWVSHAGGVLSSAKLAERDQHLAAAFTHKDGKRFEIDFNGGYFRITPADLVMSDWINRQFPE